jgi:hypothetical protein
MTQSLMGRVAECERLDAILREVAAGRGQAIVLRGEAGIGKTALLEYLLTRVDGWRVAKCMGVQWEMELAYSGLHQLRMQMLDQLDGLPEPQREALARIFGLRAGPAPDQFMVGHAQASYYRELLEAGVRIWLYP